MSSFLDQINQIIDQVNKLPNGNTKIGLLEEGIRLADLHQREDIGYELREELIEVSTFWGAPEKALLAFSWILAEYDRNPDQYDLHHLLWQYKWVIASLDDFPHISLQQIDQAMEDMSRRYKESGLGLRPLYKIACEHAMTRKDREKVKYFQKLWRSEKIDHGNDCSACERDSQVSYYLFVNDLERALKAAEPILSGKMKCGEVPHVTLPELLLPLLRKKEINLAVDYYLWAAKILNRDPDFIAEYGKLMTFLALTSNFKEGIKIFEKMLPAVLEAKALSRRFTFQLGASLLFHYLQDSGKDSISLRLPQELKLSGSKGLDKNGTETDKAKKIPSQNVQIQSLIDWIDNDLLHLAKLFDERNGTNAFRAEIDEAKNLKDLCCVIPLKKEED